jgi:phosphopantothenoylcysteine decarboxylase/phosphopantothenate--cysteine ligase
LKCLSVNDLKGERVLVTAGPTREPLDPARFLSNRSSGKMGYALARCAYRRGAQVTLISGPTSLSCPYGVKRVDVLTALQMRDAVMAEFDTSSILIKAAAVSDFRPAKEYSHKVKKESAELNLKLVQNPDILNEIGNKKENSNKIIVGFAAESKNIQEEGRKKLLKKNLDMIAVNDIGAKASGFEVDTNKVYLIDNKNVKELPLTSKMKTADLMWDHILDTFKD